MQDKLVQFCNPKNDIFLKLIFFFCRNNLSRLKPLWSWKSKGNKATLRSPFAKPTNVSFPSNFAEIKEEIRTEWSQKSPLSTAPNSSPSKRSLTSRIITSNPSMFTLPRPRIHTNFCAVSNPTRRLMFHWTWCIRNPVILRFKSKVKRTTAKLWVMNRIIGENWWIPRCIPNKFIALIPRAGRMFSSILKVNVFVFLSIFDLTRFFAVFLFWRNN